MFVAGATARATAEITAVNRNTVRLFYQRLRKLIASKLPCYELSGEVEADESYFGGVRKGKRGRGAAGKIAVFGLLKRGRKGLHGDHPQRQNRDPVAGHKTKGSA